MESVDYSLPLDFGFLKVDEEKEGKAGGSEVVDALGGVFVGEAVYAFQFDRPPGRSCKKRLLRFMHPKKDIVAVEPLGDVERRDIGNAQPRIGG
jgi:hypothetical protein